MSILDIHTHHEAPQPEALVSVSPGNFVPLEGQLYSVGIHPWDTAVGKPIDRNKLEEIASRNDVAAIGECGIDKLKGAPLFRQMQVFKTQIEISESLKKPLVIHDVKAHDIIFGLYRDIQPTQKWAIHGFRAKPGVAKMFTDTGIWLSFGEFFNPDSLKAVPKDFILAETDESSLSIENIIERLSEVRGEDLKDKILENTFRFLGRE